MLRASKKTSGDEADAANAVKLGEHLGEDYMQYGNGQFNDEWQRYLDRDIDGRGSMWLAVIGPAIMLLCIAGGTAATFGCWLFKRVM